MAAVAYATEADYYDHQLEGSETSEQLQFRLNSASERITSCLYKGRYPVSSIKSAIAAGNSYPYLKELCIVMAHLSLISGAAASEFTDSAGKTYLAYKAEVKERIELLCGGYAALSSESGDSDIEPPKYSRGVGVVGDSRKNNLDLTDPVNYSAPTKLNSG